MQDELEVKIRKIVGKHYIIQGGNHEQELNRDGCVAELENLFNKMLIDDYKKKCELETKVHIYEEIIAKSNFAPLIKEKYK